MNKKLFLHTCCAPCLTHPLELLEKDYNVTVYFYGPNIHPKTEYEMRLGEAKKYCEDRCKIIEGEYEDQHWFELTKGHEKDPERGERCRICYKIRLEKTADFAAENGFDVFTSTLSISPHKNANWVNEIGTELAGKYKIQYLPANWKKCDGFKKSLELSQKFNLKRQDYCGCAYSKNQ